MSYADIAYYADSYLLGRTPVIPTADFPYWVNRASNKIKAATQDRLAELTDSEIPHAVKECCCALAELLYRQDKQSASVGQILTIPTGVSAITPKQMTQEESAGAVSAIVMEYLMPTGLLYRGI